jgi:cytochrome c
VRKLLVWVFLVSTGATLGMSGVRGAETLPRGEVLFEHRCARCHGIGADGSEGLAPALTGVVGSPIASRKDYYYTRQMKAKIGVWTPQLLDQYLADPQGFAPGADMDVSSPDTDERTALIEYLKTLK